MFRQDYFLELTDDEAKDKIYKYLINKENILCAYIFGSFGTEDFNSCSDIDIAILSDSSLTYSECLKINSELEDIIGFPIDLNDIDALPEYIQAQVVMKNQQLFCKDDVAEDKYLCRLNHWIKTEYTFVRKLLTTSQNGLYIKKINLTRLSTTISKSEKCVIELDVFFQEITSHKYDDNEILKRSMELSFRSLFNSFQSLVEDYISIVLRTLSVDISKLYFRQSLDLCKENNFLSESFVDLFKPSIKLRNDIAHGYDVPSIETLINFYKSNKEMYNTFLTDMNNFKTTLSQDDLF